YTNFKDNNNNAIVVSSTDLQGGQVYLIFDPVNGFWEKKIVPIDLSNVWKKSDILPEKVRTWNADVGLQHPAIREKGGKIWRVISGKTTAAGDEPKIGSAVWEQISGSDITPLNLAPENGNLASYVLNSTLEVTGGGFVRFPNTSSYYSLYFPLAKFLAFPDVKNISGAKF